MSILIGLILVVAAYFIGNLDFAYIMVRAVKVRMSVITEAVTRVQQMYSGQWA